MRSIWPVFFLLVPLHVSAADLTNSTYPDTTQYHISIIIDDLGHRLEDGTRAINLPGALTYSILPHAPYSVKFAHLANQKNKEVMLHLPMEAESGRLLGKGGLHSRMHLANFNKVVAGNLSSVPYVKGINNHMGSYLTKNPVMMSWLMNYISNRGNLYFIDSMTTRHSIAMKKAAQHGVDHARRDVFLDNIRNKEAIATQLKKLVVQAKKNGSAIGIGHPYPETMSMIESFLLELNQYNDIRLIPVSELISKRKHRRLAWQKSSYR